MALVAVLVGLVAPNTLRWLAAARERGWRAELTTALRALPVQAHTEGRDLSVDAAGLKKSVPSLPAEVDIRLDRPLRYRASGVASAGSLRIVRPGYPEETWQVLALTGEPLRP